MSDENKPEVDLEAARIAALTKHLELDEDEIDEVEASTSDETMLTYGRQEYRVLTDEEADAAAREDILESVWAFKTEFLESHVDARLRPALRALDDWRSEQCESANEAVLAMIADVDHFVDDAIKADGRGHFLAGYDGEENEVAINGQTFYVYRVN